MKKIKLHENELPIEIEYIGKMGAKRRYEVSIARRRFGMFIKGVFESKNKLFSVNRQQ